MPEPRLTVAMPVKDGENYIRETLDSILGQTFGDFRVVIAENASSDATIDILADYARRDRRLTYHTEAKPLGHTPNFNRVVGLCETPWIKLICHDDLIRDDCLAQTDAAITAAADRQVALIASNFRLMVDDDKVTEGQRGGAREFYTGGDAVRLFMGGEGKPLIPNVSNTTVRKDALLAAGGFDNRFLHQDIPAWLYVLARANLFYLPDTLAIFRIHAAQITNTSNRSGHTVQDFLIFLEEFTDKHGAELGITPAMLRRAQMRSLSSATLIAMRMTRKGQIGDALRTLGLLPWHWRALVPAVALRVAWKESLRHREAMAGMTAFDPTRDAIPVAAA